MVSLNLGLYYPPCLVSLILPVVPRCVGRVASTHFFSDAFSPTLDESTCALKPIDVSCCCYFYLAYFPPLGARQSVSHPPRPLCQMFHAIYIFFAFLPLSLSLNYLVPQTNFSLIFFLFSFFPFLCCADEKSSQAGSRQRREVSLCLSLFLSLPILSLNTIQIFKTFPGIVTTCGR